MDCKTAFSWPIVVLTAKMVVFGRNVSYSALISILTPNVIKKTNSKKFSDFQNRSIISILAVSVILPQNLNERPVLRMYG